MAEAEAPIHPLFEPDGDGFEAAPMTRGPWDAAMMHGGAPSALLAHAIEHTEPGSDLAVTRITIEFLAGVPIGPVAVATSVAKPGRRFQVVDATLEAGGRAACLARAVRLRRADLPGAAAAPESSWEPLPAPATGQPLPLFVDHDRELFYPDATEIRQVGGTLGSGHVAAWIRLRGDVLTGEAPSPLSRAVAAADFTNGLSWILPFEEWLFVNTELTVHVHRAPQGEWIGVDARTTSDAGGIALATAALHDLDGPFGTAAQSLFVERR